MKPVFRYLLWTLAAALGVGAAYNALAAFRLHLRSAAAASRRLTLEQTLSAGRHDLASAREKLRRTSAAQPAKSEAQPSQAPKWTDPAYQRLERLQMRGSALRKYGPFLESLSLEEDLARTLEALLAEREYTILTAIRDVGSDAPRDPDRRRVFDALVARDIDSRIASVLGATAYDSFARYESTYQQHDVVAKVAMRMRDAGFPMEASQQRAIVDLLVATTPPFSAASAAPDIPDAVVQEAAKFLSPHQLDCLVAFQAQRAARSAMIGYAKHAPPR